MVKPIKPSEINTTLPEFVITGINNAIQNNYRGRDFTVKQKEIVEEIMKVAPEGITEDDIYDKNYLDFEKLYIKHGWHVEHDKPGYNETYDAYFTFKPKKL